MSYVDRNLLPDEVVCHRAKVHWAALIPRAFGTFSTALGLGIAGMHVLWVVLVLLIGSVAVLDVVIVRWTTELAVTDARVILKRGLISRYTVEVRLEKVETINVSQGIVGRLLGFGDVRVVGSGGTNERALWIGDPVGFRNAVARAADEKGKP